MPQPLIAVFGVKGSSKERIFETLTGFKVSTKNVFHLLPCQINLENFLNLHLLYTLDMHSFSDKDYINIFSSIEQLASNHDFKIIQLVFCFNKSDQAYVQQTYESIQKLIKVNNHSYITFIQENINAKESFQYINKSIEGNKFNCKFILDIRKKGLESWLQNLKTNEIKIQFNNYDINSQKENEIIAQQLIEIWEKILNQKNLFSQWENFFKILKDRSTKTEIQICLEGIIGKYCQQIERQSSFFILLTSFKNLLQQKNLTQNVNNFLNQQNIWCFQCRKFYLFEEEKVIFLDENFILQQMPLKKVLSKGQHSCQEKIMSQTNNGFPKFIEQIILSQTLIIIQDTLFINSLTEPDLKSIPHPIQRKRSFQNNLQNSPILEQKREQLSQLSRNSTLQLQNSEMNFEESQQTLKYLTAIILSNENDKKNFFFTKLTAKQTKQDEFTKSELLNKKFYLVDAPQFTFDEEVESKTELFSDYFNSNILHFIFFCVEFQRCDIIKTRLNQMYKKLHNVDNSRLGLIILNRDSRISKDNQQIIYQLATVRSIQKVIFVWLDDTKQHILMKISKCLENVDETPIFFSQTVFEKQTDQQLKIGLDLFQKTITSQIINGQKKDEQYFYTNQLSYFEKQQKNSLLKQITIKNEIQNLKNELKQKEQDLKIEIRNHHTINLALNQLKNKTQTLDQYKI